MSTGTKILDLLRQQAAESIREAEVRRMFLPSERYVIDFDEGLREWRQYDTRQDASYFGVWVHLGTLETLTYAEGDWSLVTCADRAGLRAELAAMAEFYGAPPPAAVAFGLDGTRTDYFDPRPEVES